MIKHLFLWSLLGGALLLGGMAYGLLRTPLEASGAIHVFGFMGGPEPGEGLTRFQFDEGLTRARFVLEETLQGEPKTVVGSTSAVRGHLALDPLKPSTASAGPIQVNARTLVTDSPQRDRAIKNYVLKSDQYEFITFIPEIVDGLPVMAGVGAMYEFQMTGPLTIAGVTREATFDVAVTNLSAQQIYGTAVTAVRYQDWGITIPQVPLVAWVADEVKLQLEFVAEAN